VPTNFLSKTLVLIPARNEATSVAATVCDWRALGAYMVRVVDNGSSDETAAIARDSGAEVLSEPRAGYGSACWTGLAALPEQVEWILFSSADGSDRLSVDDLARWDGVADSGADLVIGDRFSLPEARQHLKLVQRGGNTLCCALIWLGWRRRFRDLGSLRLLHRDAWRRLNLQDRGFGWNIEMQVRAIELKLKIVELPVMYYPRRAGVSKISGSVVGTVRAAWAMTRMISRLWLSKSSASPIRPSIEPAVSACGHSVSSHTRGSGS
jgi:glycosyltransferase involved in cell wall biosynthesis